MRSTVFALVLAIILLPSVVLSNDNAPIPDEVIQKVVHEPLNAARNSLPVSVAETLNTLAKELEAIALDEGLQKSRTTVVKSFNQRRAHLNASKNELQKRRGETLKQIAATRNRFMDLGLKAKVKTIDDFKNQVVQRFDSIDAAIAEVEKSSAGDRGNKARKTKVRLDQFVSKMRAVESVSAEPITTFRQDIPLKNQPQTEAKQLPLYLSGIPVESESNTTGKGAAATSLALAPPTPTETQDCNCTVDDLGQTQEEVKQTTEILALAEKLEYSPTKIFKYVHDNITYEPYYGSLKGAQGTLISSAGNDTDQASLLVALLRASNIPARYIKGTIRVLDSTPAGQNGRAAQWLGAKDYAGAVAILGQGRNPSSGSITNASNQEIGVQLTHVWVEACVPYGHYRGVKIDNAGHRWIPLDPSFKDKKYQAGLSHSATFDYTGYLAKRTNGPDSLPHETYAQRIRTSISSLNQNASLADVPYRGSIIPLKLDILPASLPYDVITFLAWGEGNTTAEAATLPEGHRYQLKTTVSNAANVQLATTTLAMPEHVLKRITLSFKGATPGDEDLLADWRTDGNLAAIPGAINVVPVIKSDAIDQVTGSQAVALTTPANSLNLQLLLPELGTGDCSTGARSCLNSVTYTNIGAANYHALQAYAFQASDQLLRTRTAKLLATVKNTPNPNTNLEETEGEFLHIVGLKYMRSITDASKRIGELDGGSGESGNHLGLTSSQMKVSYLFDLPFAIERKGFLVDVPGGLSRNTDLTSGALMYKTFLLSGYSSSAFESFIWQENAHLDAVSTVRGLQYARETGIEVLTVTSVNWATESPKLTSNANATLNYASAYVNSVKTNYIDKGFTLIIPRSLIEYGNWRGAVFAAEKEEKDALGNTTGGSAGFIIGGSYAGGYAIGDPISSVYNSAINTGYWYETNMPASAYSDSDDLAAVAIGVINNGINNLISLAGDPVNVVTGNMYHPERDLSIPGRGGLPIVFERSYNSRIPQDGPLGFGWTHSFNHYLKFYGVEGGLAKVSWVDGTGNEKFFATTNHRRGNVAVNATLTNPGGVFVTFQRLANGTYQIREKNGLTYLFESLNGTTGGGQKAKLQSIADRNGNALTMTYTGADLTRVKDSLNRALTFTCTGGHITQIQDFSGRIFQYGYDGAGNLTSYKNPLAVSSPATQPPVTYTYYAAEDGVNVNHAMKSYQLPRGNGMTFEYYANGRAFRHTNSMGEVNRFTYNDFRRETMQVNERGFERRFFFSEYGVPLKIIEENGAEWTYAYDPNAPLNRLSQTDPLGYTTSYTYDAKGNVTTITSPRGTTETFSNFDAFNQPQRIKDHRDNYSVLKYSGNGNLLEHIRLKAGVVPVIPYTVDAGQVVSWSVNTYDTYGNLQTGKQVRDIATMAGPVVSSTFDANSLYPTGISRLGDKNGDGLINTSDPADSRSLVYDPLGRVLTGINADWHITHFTYDVLGRIVTGSDALGQTRNYTYDANGNLIEQKLEIEGTVWDKTSWQYDLSDRRIEATDNAGAQTLSEYDPAGNVVKVTNPDGYNLSFTYDAANRAIKANDPEGNTVGTERDMSGKPRSLIDPNQNTTSYSYWGTDRNGQLKRKTLPAIAGFSQGRAVEYDYDPLGNVISESRIAADASAPQTSLTTYDELSRPVRVAGASYTDASLGAIRPVTRYSYNLLGLLTEIKAGRTDAAGTNPGADVVTVQTSFISDDFGRKLKATDALDHNTLFAYDINGNITQRTDANGQVTTFTWGHGHQLLTQNSSAGNVTVTRNPLGQPIRTETKAEGNASVLVAYDVSYDAAHRPETIMDSRGPSLHYGFSPGGRLMSVEDGHGNQTNYLYDPANRLTGIWAPNYGTISYRYDAGGRLTEKWLPNGVNSRYSYNADDSLQQLVNRRTTLNIISQHTYGYDGFGNRKSQVENTSGVIVNYTYAYDGLNRLVQVANGTPAQQEDYSYDPLGNRTAKTMNATTPVQSVSLFDAANQLLEVRSGSASGLLLQAYVYDAAGNLIKKAEGGTVTRTPTDCTGNTVTGLAYNSLNRLSQVSKTGLATEQYAYDDAGRRIRKTIGATATNFAYMGPDIYAEYPASFTTPTALYTHGPHMDDPILRQGGMGPNATVGYFHQDGLGSVIASSNESGTIAAVQRFDAWGNRVAGTTASVPRFGYTGREPDATGLTYYRARYYDPTVGRFTQWDPIGLRGGINGYAYVGGNPVNFTDPNGLVAKAIGNYTVETAKSYYTEAVNLNNTFNQVLFSPVTLLDSIISPDDQIGLMMAAGPVAGESFALTRNALTAFKDFSTAAEGYNATSAANATRLRTQLAFEEAGILTRGGAGLTDEAIAAARDIPVAGGQLTNQAVVEELTRGGGSITDWGKFTTQSVNLPTGQSSQIHFYKNIQTGEVNLNIDFKVKGVVQ